MTRTLSAPVPRSGTLLVVERAEGPVYYGKWRDSTGRQMKRRIGPAWLERSRGEWTKRRGRQGAGWLDPRAAHVALEREMTEREIEIVSDIPALRDATFSDAAGVWMHHLEHVKGAKPSTLNDYRYLLARPGTPARKRGRPPAAKIMRAFGHRPLAQITIKEVSRYLRDLDETPGFTSRTVNKHRQVIAAVLQHAMREDTYALPSNPAAATDKRREPDVKPVEFYEPEEVMALARAASLGEHRDPSRPAVGDQEIADRARADEQDATIFIVAAFTGLRLGELLALRWKNVSFSDAKLVVDSSWSSGVLTSPKSRKWRAVPLADQPAATLARLAERDRFTGRDDLVFAADDGGYLDPSALRRRYRRAQTAAGLRAIRFHDLRHSFGSLVIREFDPVSVKDFMGHAKLTTTERYLHARSRRTDAARLTKAFDGLGDDAVLPDAVHEEHAA